MNLSRLNARDLENHARVVDAQIKRILHRPRPTPTPTERQLVASLKKVRLAMKDRLDALHPKR